MGDIPDVIFVSMEDWDEVWRRNQFVCAELIKRNPGIRVLFVGRPLDVSNAVRRGRWRRDPGRTTRPVPGMAGVVLTHPPKLFPNSLAAGRLANEAMFRWYVRRAAEAHRLRRPVLWLNPHYAVHMVGRMGERGVIYDVTDDWTMFDGGSAREAALTAEQDRELCRRATATIVCSQRLYELKRPLCSDLRLIPNGVHVQHYRRVLDAAGQLPDVAGRWERPVLGYTGSIHPERVDVGLIEQVATRMSSGTIVLVGPDMLSPPDRQRLAATGRVCFTGPVAYRDLPDLMRAFDVCVVPHRVSPFTDSLNPIKLWEYLAAGKPIVSTPVAGFRDFPKLVHLAGDADEFVAAVGRALAEDPALGGQRRGEAAGHSWASRVQQVEQVLQSV
jgi:teichuronic acid biosynthesis glycosyltransferase TuaH